MRNLFLLFLGIALTINTFGQSSDFSIHLEPMTINGLGGLQSYAFGQYDGKWLIVGGRLDGLHRRQPFAAFDVAGNNNQLLVIDPINQQKWTASLNSLPAGIQEQLSASNAEFFQEGNYLYIVGGYGHSATINNHTTFNKLTAIHVPNVINTIINGGAISSHFRQITDDQFAVTGGQLEKMHDTYYLVGGHKFIGRYNPMGPTHGPGFTQTYTNQIRKFNINDDGTTIGITHFAPHTDTAQLHRRDYNVTPQIMSNGEEGLTAFSGVFQHNVDLPFLNCVHIDSAGYMPDNNFTQHYNHYHCANIPLYSEVNNEMHTVFFGGIAQFYDSLGTLVQDNDIPFVRTIARVTRDANGTMKEYKLNTEMPALLGAGSEFIPLETLPFYSNHVLKMDSLTNDTTLLGHIYGGINSTAKNIFWINTGTQSTANNEIFKVFLVKNTTSKTHQLNAQSVSSLKLEVYPNPNNGIFKIRFNMEEQSDIKIWIHDISGKLLHEEFYANQPAGYQRYQRDLEGLAYGTVFFVTVETNMEKVTRKIMIEP